jgi:glutathione peroxidase
MLITRIAVLSGLLLSPAALVAKDEPQPQSLYEMKARSIDGKPVSLSSYKGKVAIVANTASKCGFTPQYKQLQAVYEKYKDRGLVVLGFPSNDFLSQEPASDPEIKKFCELNYGVTFPLFAKDHVKGKETQPVFRYLKDSPVGKKDGEIGWNFTKFLVDQDGRVAARFATKVKPDAPEVTAKIEELLAASKPKK